MKSVIRHFDLESLLPRNRATRRIEDVARPFGMAFQVVVGNQNSRPVMRIPVNWSAAPVQFTLVPAAPVRARISASKRRSRHVSSR